MAENTHEEVKESLTERLAKMRQKVDSKIPEQKPPVVEPAPPPTQETIEVKVQSTIPKLPSLAHWKGLGQPSSHDRRSQVPFEARYRKENVMVDRRMLAAFYDLMERAGRSKVESFNRVLLDVLLQAGYPLDPNLLDRPFTWEDLPK